jgi:hypothetical protein
MHHAIIVEHWIRPQAREWQAACTSCTWTGEHVQDKESAKVAGYDHEHESAAIALSATEKAEMFDRENRYSHVVRVWADHPPSTSSFRPEKPQ